jgi:hypothetical protein
MGPESFLGFTVHSSNRSSRANQTISPLAVPSVAGRGRSYPRPQGERRARTRSAGSASAGLARARRSWSVDYLLKIVTLSCRRRPR